MILLHGKVYLKQIGFWLLFLLVNLTYGQEAKWERFIEKADNNSKREFFYVLELDQNANKYDMDGLSLNVIRVLDQRHLIVKIPREKSIAELSPVVTWIRPANHLWKLSPALMQSFQEKKDDAHIQSFAIQVANIIAFREKLARIAPKLQIQKNYPSTGLLVVEGSYQAIYQKLLPHPAVHFIQEMPVRPRLETEVRDANPNVNRVNLLHHLYPELEGQGQIVSIREPAYNTEDVDLRGRHISSGLEANTVSEHTTEMATIIAGAGNSSIRGRGVARAATLTSSDFGVIFPDAEKAYQDLGVFVQNHSYGTEINNLYDSFAQAYDHNAHQLPELLHVFSVGNAGQEASQEGNYENITGYANLTGSFKMAKNILTVGAVDTLLELEDLVSRGPAYDGRIKPELVAYSSVGSSNAAALVSGVSTLLQQFYQEKFSGEAAPSALIKALLINSAEDVGTQGPDFRSGYGNVNAGSALESLANQQFFEASLVSGETRHFDLEIPANAMNLKITLVWNDPPALIQAPQALVNDLDLKLVFTDSETTFLPWVLNHDPHVDSLQMPAQRGEDHLNNIEQVSLAEPQAGTYQITVQASEELQGSQICYVVYQWEEAEQFRWTFPSGSDQMPFSGERVSIFRWEASYPDQTGKLEISLDAGNSWQTIEESVNLQKGFYSWTAPDTTVIAQARMQIQDETYLSELFPISYPLRPTLGFNCEDSLLVQWASIPEVEQYKIYTLGDLYLEEIAQTQDTFLILPKSALIERKYTVIPQLNPRYKGIQALLADYTQQGLDCYLVGWSVFREEGKGMQLILELGSNHQVESVILERLEGQEYLPIQSLGLENNYQKRWEYLDATPLEGQNTYRARVIFENGDEFFTLPASDYFLREKDLLLFPNPLSRDQELNLYTRDLVGETLHLQIFDSRGQLIFQNDFNRDRESLSLSQLPSGLYLYKLQGKQFFQAGKLVID